MPRNVNQPMQREQDRGDKRGEAITLIGSFPQRKYFPNNKDEAGDHENNSNPAKLSPQPQPIALGMDRATVAVGSSAENREDVFKIAKTDPNPGRIAD